MLKVNAGAKLLKQYTWTQVQKKFEKLDPKLFQIINKLALDDTYLFTEVLYQFGRDIIKDGEIYISTPDGGTISINDQNLPDELKTNTPLFFILEKNCEFYLPMSERIVSEGVATPGCVLGFSGILNADIQDEYSPVFPEDLRAGARSLVTLAPITDNAGFDRLKKGLKLKSEKLISSMQQGELFGEMAQNGEANWWASCLFLDRKLIERLKHRDPEVIELYAYLLKLHRDSYGSWHNKKSKLWNAYLQRIEEEMRLNPSYSSALNIANHIISIAAGGMPGYIPSTNEAYAPIKFLQDQFINTYDILRLVKQFPTMLVPIKIADDGLPVYYFLNHPTQPGHKPDGRSSKSIRANLDLVMRVIEIYRSWIVKSDAKTKVPALYNALMNYKYEPYHPDPADYKDIKNSAVLFEEDTRFCNELSINPEHSIFFKGCIKINKV